MTRAELLNIKDFPFEIKDKNGNLIYFEDSTGYWSNRNYDSNNNKKFFEDSNGYWAKTTYDSNGNKLFTYDSNGNQVFYENL